MFTAFVLMFASLKSVVDSYDSAGKKMFMREKMFVQEKMFERICLCKRKCLFPHEGFYVEVLF